MYIKKVITYLKNNGLAATAVQTGQRVMLTTKKGLADRSRNLKSLTGFDKKRARKQRITVLVLTSAKENILNRYREHMTAIDLGRQSFQGFDLMFVKKKSKLINEIVRMINTDYILLLDEKCWLKKDAVKRFLMEFQKDSRNELVYSDSCTIKNGSGGTTALPCLKPDNDFAYLSAVNYIGTCFAFKRKTFLSLGGLTENFPPCTGNKKEKINSALYGLLLELSRRGHVAHIPQTLYFNKEITSENAPEPCNQLNTDFQTTNAAYLDADHAQAAVLQDFYARKGIKATVTLDNEKKICRTDYALTSEPLVSIIVPNCDHVEELKQCMEWIDRYSTYRNYEWLIVENNSNDETWEFYSTLSDRPDVTILDAGKSESFNFSALINLGADYASGEYLLFLNNDTRLINPDSIRKMLSDFAYGKVGTVGAKLLYADDTVQHAGIIVGAEGLAGNAFVGEPKDSPGYMKRLICPSELSAVTAACMMVPVKALLETQGFDTDLPVNFNDVDFCLRLRKKGYRIIYEPEALFYHFESKSRGRDCTPAMAKRYHEEISLFEKRHGKLLRAGDPFYNPGLGLRTAGFRPKKL